MRYRSLALALVALSATGCADGQLRAVERAAADFSSALAAGDAPTACGMLAPLTLEELESSQGSDCAEALEEQGLSPAERTREVQRFGRQAAVVVDTGDGGTDTWFLSRFDDRWLVVAAGCRPRGGQLPYSCDVEGP